MPLVKLTHVNKVFKLDGELSFHALKNINLTINKGEFVAITGQSGSGKSTIMNIVGLLDQPTSGKYELDDQDVSRLSSNHLAEIRNRKIGFIFQNFNLLARTTALENVALPLIYTGVAKNERITRAKDSLEKVGLAEKLKAHPNQLSGGQQQRVAIARALVTEPEVILADEPTGNLDSKSGAEVLKLLQDLHAEGKTVVLITHDQAVSKIAGRVIKIKDGEISKE